MLLIFPNPQEPFGRNSNTIQTPPNGADLNYTANPSSSFPSLPWTQAISRGTLWCSPPPAPFFHSVSLPLARACWWLEAKELSGNWIQSQDNKDKNKMQVRATPLSPPEPKNESAFANGNGSRHVSRGDVRILANKTSRTRWKASETWGSICVFNKSGPHVPTNPELSDKQTQKMTFQIKLHRFSRCALNTPNQ